MPKGKGRPLNRKQRAQAKFIRAAEKHMPGYRRTVAMHALYKTGKGAFNVASKAKRLIRGK